MIFISDVDGVLTNGQFTYTEQGKVSKVFGPHDADGVKYLKKYGIDVIFISADVRGSKITAARIKDMNCDFRVVSESERLGWIKSRYDITNDVIYMGDGIHDAEILKQAFMSIAPNNARWEAKAKAQYVTPTDGGNGAFLDAAIYTINELERIKNKKNG